MALTFGNTFYDGTHLRCSYPCLKGYIISFFYGGKTLIYYHNRAPFRKFSFVKFPKDFQRHLVMSISAQAAIDLGKENLEKSIPDVIVLILKEAFQIVCIFLLNKGIAGLG